MKWKSPTLSDRMMKFELSHDTRYTYSEKVFFEPHIFRFKPKETPHSTLHNFTIQIDPEPSGQSEQVDIEGNQILNAWFEHTHQEMVIKSRSIIEIRDFNPYNFLVHPPEFLHLPFQYSQQDQQLLAPALKTLKLPVAMKEFLEGLLKESGYQSITFLSLLNRTIFQKFILESRESGSPHDPDFTFSLLRGSCRDLAWMQIHMLRQVKIASRFVSGYFYPDTDHPEFELHAWVEAYLPGAGWIGFDPGHGILAGNRHIPLATSAVVEHTMPVTGTIRGDASVQLNTDLQISVIG
ncbi:MAG: transglutaminase family protein [Bacteroidales bacterium]